MNSINCFYIFANNFIYKKFFPIFKVLFIIKFISCKLHIPSLSLSTDAICNGLNDDIPNLENIKFENVSFQYEKGKEDAINNINLNIFFMKHY